MFPKGQQTHLQFPVPGAELFDEQNTGFFESHQVPPLLASFLTHPSDATIHFDELWISGSCSRSSSRLGSNFRRQSNESCESLKVPHQSASCACWEMLLYVVRDAVELATDKLAASQGLSERPPASVSD